MKKLDRRQALKSLAALGAGAAVSGFDRAQGANKKDSRPAPPKAQGKSVMGLVVPKMDVVRVGFIGVGERGYEHVRQMLSIDGVDIKAICDTHDKVLNRALKMVQDTKGYTPLSFTGTDHAYRQMLDRDDIDIVIIATPWRWHVPMALDTMESGKHAFLEVPAAFSLEDCWALVDTSERTQMNCMMMENVCYGREELAVLNMARQGVFGELTHGEGAYIHELRWQMKEIDHKTGSWRTAWHTKINGNLYPTHGLGPIAQYMNINRGDRFDYLSSVSSPALGRQAYAAKEFAADHARNKAHYSAGDMNTSIIKTVKGRSIMVQHDTTTPRPYSRLNLLQGTKGALAGFPGRYAFDDGSRTDKGQVTYHRWNYDMEALYAKYDHPLWTRIGDMATEQGGHGGMDFVMLWRMIYCLRNGQPLDQNVYDAAAWSAVIPLSVASVAERSNSQDFPDFTRGTWKTNKPLGIVS